MIAGVKHCQLARKFVILMAVSIDSGCTQIPNKAWQCVCNVGDGKADREATIETDDDCRCDTLPTGEKICDPYGCKLQMFQ